MLMKTVRQWKGRWARAWQPYVNTSRPGISSSALQKRCRQPFILTTRKLSVSWKSTSATKPCRSAPKKLGTTLDRPLTYRRHLESLRKKLTSPVALLRRLAGSGWGAAATTLRTVPDLVHSTAEYCAGVWCRSAHTRLIDPAINDALRIVTGCLRPTPADNLPILAGIQRAELLRMNNPSTSSWTALPDGSGRWDNWTAAKHLPRDLVRPSSGYEELT